jgi:hypothetical protein
MTNVQSVVTPATNGVAIPAKATKATKATKTKALQTTAPAAPVETRPTAEQAIQIAFEFGQSMAGHDGILTKTVLQFEDDDDTLKSMEKAIAEGYMVRKLGYTREQATTAVNKLKHNNKKMDDNHRTFDEQRIMNTVRVLWHRANKWAGIVKPKSEKQVEAETKRAEKDAERKTHVEHLEEAWNIVHPKEDVDVNEAMTRLVSTMKAYHSQHAAKFVGDTGSAWRKWLAAAPKA